MTKSHENLSRDNRPNGRHEFYVAQGSYSMVPVTVSILQGVLWKSSAWFAQGSIQEYVFVNI